MDFFVVAFVFSVSENMTGHISLGNNFLHTSGRVREKIFPSFFFFCASEVANAEVILQEIFLWILHFWVVFIF